MLPFGSITSIIPLSVLAIAYVLFIGASALNRIKPAPVDSPGKEIFVNDGVQGQAQKTILFYSQIRDIVKTEDISDVSCSTEWVCRTLTDLPPEILFTGYPNFIFSRPPPSLFS